MEAFRNFRLIWEMVAENSIDHFEDFKIIFIWKNNLKKLKFPSIMIKNLHYKGNISDIHRNHYSIDMCNKHHRKGKRLFWFKKKSKLNSKNLKFSSKFDPGPMHWPRELIQPKRQRLIDLDSTISHFWMSKKMSTII